MQNLSALLNQVLSSRAMPAARIAADESKETALRNAHRLVYWLDERFQIPGIDRRIGLDALLGLVPGVGDLVTTALGGYIVAQAVRHKAPRLMITRMAWNLAVDTLIGAVPLLGDIFDIAWKANRKNARLLAEYLETQRRLKVR